MAEGCGVQLDTSWSLHVGFMQTSPYLAHVAAGHCRAHGPLHRASHAGTVAMARLSCAKSFDTTCRGIVSNRDSLVFDTTRGGTASDTLVVLLRDDESCVMISLMPQGAS